MKRSKHQVIAALALIAGLLTPAAAQQDSRRTIGQEIARLNWQIGPAVGKLGDKASIDLTSGYGFLNATGTSRFLSLMENLPSPNSYTVAPKNLNWFAIFHFSDTGYIKDDEKIDADAVLKTLKANNARGNEERKRRGYPPLYLEDWFIRPHYDEQTKRLEWATRLRAENGKISVNYSIRLLGRAGVMNAILVTNPNSLTGDVRDFKSVLTGYNFDSGQRYSEFRTGDKIAAYGLTGLIVGGAAAVAAKTGLFKLVGKFFVYIFGGIVVLAGGLVKTLFGRRSTA